MKKNRREVIAIYLNRKEKDKINEFRKELEHKENIEVSLSEIGRLSFEKIMKTDTRTVKNELIRGDF